MKKILTIISLMSISLTIFGFEGTKSAISKEVEIDFVLKCSPQGGGIVTYIDATGKVQTAHIKAYPGSYSVYRDEAQKQDEEGMIKLCQSLKDLSQGLPGTRRKVHIFTFSGSSTSFDSSTTCNYNIITGLSDSATGTFIHLNRTIDWLNCETKIEN